MYEELVNLLRTNTNELLQSISRFDYMQFNQKPVTGGWTAGAIAEHILLVEINIGKLILSKSVACERDAQEKIDLIKKTALDRTKRIEAPNSLVPTDTPKDPNAFSEKILAERRHLIQIITQVDLLGEYPDRPHRIYGILSGIEWINFLIYHCRRHIAQLNELYTE